MNVNVTKIERLSNGIIQFYNGNDVVDSFSITSSVSVLFENNLAKSISFVSNVKTLSFNVYNIQSVYGSTSNKIYSSGIDPSDTGSAYISRLYDIYAFIISDVIQGCCPGPTFVGGVVVTYPDYASFPATGQESVIYIDEATNQAYFWDGSSYQPLISVSSADKMTTIGRNSTGSTLYKGTIIYISGSTGNRPNYVKAQANSEATSAGTFGVILSDIANNSDGYAVTIGTIDNLDTRSTAPNPFTSDTLVDGDTIYLSPTTAGYVTNVKPYAPDHLVYVGKVVRTSPTNGVIVYRIQNGYELDEIHDVAAQTPSNNDGLFFESSTSLWKNKSISTVLGYTPVPETRTLTINGTTQDLSADRTFNVGTFNLPSLTSGSVLFSNGTTIAQDNANLFFDDTNNRLGVGSAAPVSRLSVVDSASTVASLTANAASHFNISRGTSGVTNLVFTISGVAPNVATIQHRHSNIDGIGYPIAINPLGGNVGIGTVAPAAPLVVQSNSGALGISIRQRTGNDFANLLFTNLSDTTLGGVGYVSTSRMRFMTGGLGDAFERLSVFQSTGNIGIGTTTDAGFKLDVNGTARVRGASNVGTTTALTVINSDSTTLLQVQDNGYIRVGSQGTSAFRVYSTDASGDAEPSGLHLVLNSRVVSSATPAGIGMVMINGINGTATTGTQNVFLISKGFAPTSGTATYAATSIISTINQTGGANGITRGLYINPTLTAAADFRAIETTAGNVLFGASGTGFFWDDTNNRLGIGTASPQDTFTVSGQLGNLTSELSVINTNGGKVTFRAGVLGVTNSGFTLLTALQDGTSETARLAVSSNGNLLINTTTDAGYKLDVNGTARVSGSTTFGTLGTSTGMFWDNTNNRLGIGTSSPAYIAHISAPKNTTSLFITSPLLNTANDVQQIAFGVTGSASTLTAIRTTYVSPSTSTRCHLSFYTTGTAFTEGLRLTDNSNVLINTTTDAGFKLDVNGTARVSGQLTVTGNISCPNTIGTTSSSAFTGFTLLLGGGTTNATTYLAVNGTNSTSSGTSNGISNNFTFQPTSGTANAVAFSYQGTINQTGGANGITRGLYINPTLTAAADWRAIEVASGITILGASTTAKASLRIPSGTAPTSPVNGDIWFDGTDIKMRIGGVTKTFTLV